MLLDPSERKQEHSYPLGSQSEDTAILQIKSMLMMLHLLPMHMQQGYFKKLQMVTLIHLVAHLALPTDRKEHLRLRALSIPSVLQDISSVAR